MTFCEDEYKIKVGSGDVKGTKKDDFLKGWNTDDELRGKKGADLIFGMGGDDKKRHVFQKNYEDGGWNKQKKLNLNLLN